MDFTRSLNLNLQQTVGSGQQNIGDTVAGTYNAASQGVLDIPSGSATGTVFLVPLGSIGNPKSVFIKNAGPSGSVNYSPQGTGVGTGAFEITAGGSLDIQMPLTPTGKPITNVAVSVAASQPGLGQIQYVILGD